MSDEKKLKLKKKDPVEKVVETPSVPVVPVVPSVPVETVVEKVKKNKKKESSVTVPNVPNVSSSEVTIVTKSRKVQKQKDHQVVQQPVEQVKGSKTTSENIDRIVRTLMNTFELNEREVKNAILHLLPTTSTFKKNKKREEGAPKKPNSSYILFTTQNRPSVVASNADIKFAEVTIELGKRWKAMTEQDKKPYEELAEKDKARYAAELKAFRDKKESSHAAGIAAAAAASGVTVET